MTIFRFVLTWSYEASMKEASPMQVGVGEPGGMCITHIVTYQIHVQPMMCMSYTVGPSLGACCSVSVHSGQEPTGCPQLPCA